MSINAKHDKAVRESLQEIFGGGSRLSDDEVKDAIMIGQNLTRGQGGRQHRADLDIMTIVTNPSALDNIIDHGDMSISRQELRDEMIDYLIERLEKIKRMSA
jgi:hypothetical protein